MKLEYFEELLDQYGWDLASWPDRLRREANILIANDVRAAEQIRSLRALEDILSDDPLPMGKHKAIDDIFAAIDAAEAQNSSEIASGSAEEDGPFQIIDDRPKSRMHIATASAAPAGQGPARKTYPKAAAVSPTRTAMAMESANYAGRKNHLLRWLGKRTFSVTGIVVCVAAGFVFGVTLTVQQGQQEVAKAEDIEMINLLESHAYSLKPISPYDDAAPDITSGPSIDRGDADK